MEGLLTLDEVLGEDLMDPQKEAEQREKKARNLKKRYEYLDVDQKMKLTLHESTLISQDDIFLENAEEYRCAICSQVFRDPVTDDCDHQPHTFCNKCLAKTLAIKKLCPISRKAMDNFKFSINTAMNKRVNALRCKCYYFEYGCNWTGVFLDVDKHVIGCQRMTFKCTKCEILLNREEVEDHIAFCDKRRIKCKMCKAWEGTIAEQQEHDDDCPEWTVTCQYCKGYVVRKNFKVHLEKICQSYIVSCPFENMGCPEKLQRGEVQKHIWNDSQGHLEAFYKVCVSIINKIESRNLTDIMNDHSDDVLLRIRKAIVLLKKKIAGLNEEVIKTNTIVQEYIKDHSEKGQTPKFPVLQSGDYASSIKCFQINFEMLQGFVNKEREVSSRKEIIQSIEDKLNSVGREINEVIIQISEYKRVSETKTHDIVDIKKNIKSEKTKLQTFDQQFEEIQKENTALQQTLKEKEEILRQLQLNIGNSVHSSNKKSCCNIF